MKLSITVGGVAVDNYTDASIVYDAKYSSTAAFTTRQPTDGTGWYSNLSKILINGRELQPESAAWGFEEPRDFEGWYTRNASTVTALTADAQDIHDSLYGQASLEVNLPAGITVDLFRAEYDSFNLNGMTFWGWFAAGAGGVYVTPYATDGKALWEGQRVAVTQKPQWAAAGMRVQATQIQPDIPQAVTEWGFHLETAGAATVHMDAVDLCGHAYPAGVQLPPFGQCNAGAVYGSLACFSGHPCSNWDEHDWANAAHIVPTDAGWCPTTGAWDYFVWADARVPKPDDYQWI